MSKKSFIEQLEADFLERSQADKSWIEQLPKTIANIQIELGCNEAEAYFTLRLIGERSANGFKYTREEALKITKNIMVFLETFRQVAEEDPKYILESLLLCSGYQFPMPDWAVEKFRDRIDNYKQHKAKTLDEEFGTERPSHYRQDKEREVIEKSFLIYRRCRELQSQGVRIGINRKGDGLFETVAKEYAMSVGKIKEYYYMYDKSFSHAQIDKIPPLVKSSRKKE